MHFHFDSLEELVKFVKFINQDLNTILKEDSHLLDKSAQSLKQSVNQSNKGETK